ncbi:MAG: carboxypeptidase-like regulatory domain-containing protein [Marinicella pacifica]
MKKLYIAFLVLVSFNVWADATLSGVVRDGSNNPMADVQVFVVKGNGYGGVLIDYTAVTDANGGYTITIPYGGMQHAVVNEYGLYFEWFDYENQPVILEFASDIAVPHRWNDSGGRLLNCALGCSEEGASNDEKITLGAGTFTTTLTDITMQGAGKIYNGTVFDKDLHAIEGSVVKLTSAAHSNFKAGYLPSTSDVNGHYSFPMVPNDSVMYVSALKAGYIKTFHDGTQCDIGGFCLPAEPANTTQNDLVLLEAGSIVINPPTMPQNVSSIYRWVYVHNSKGEQIHTNCTWYDANSTCRIDGLLPSEQYHLIFLGRNYDNNNQSIDLMRQLQNGQVIGCGSHFDPSNFPVSGMNVTAGKDTVIAYPDLQPGTQIRGYVIDKDTQLPITVGSSGYGYLDFELIDSTTLKSAGLLIANYPQNNEWTFSNCGFAAIPDGNYYLSAANKIDYASFVDGGQDVMDYKRFVHDGIDCQGKLCDFTNATEITVNGNDINGLEVTLEKGSRIEGCYYDNSQNPIIYQNGDEFLSSKLSVHIYSTQNEHIEIAADIYQDMGNNQYHLCYSSSALPAGDYYVRTNNGSAKYLDRKNILISSISGFDPSYGFFDTTPGIGSPNCSGHLCAMNTAITLDGSSHVTRDFYLSQGPVISGSLKDNVTGSLLVDKNILAELYQNNVLIGQYQFVSEYAKFLTPGLHDGNYEIRLSGNANYLNTSLLNRGAQQTSQLTDRIPVTINGTSVDIGTITAITDMIFRDGME